MKRFDFVSGFEPLTKLPTRATSGSSGYDFYAPLDFEVKAGVEVLIPTGIRFITDEMVWLMCMPRSGLGFKYGVRLANTIGNIDSDYWKSDNEGHIMLKIIADKDFSIKRGDRIAQGVIVPYYIVDDDMPLSDTRNGGFGSTDKR